MDLPSFDSAPARRAGIGGLIVAGAILAGCGGGGDSTPPSTTETPTVDETTTTSAPPTTETTIPSTTTTPEQAFVERAEAAVLGWSELSNRAVDAAPVVAEDGTRRNPLVEEFATVLAGKALDGFAGSFNADAADGVVPLYRWTPKDIEVVSVTLENGRAVAVLRACARAETTRESLQDLNGDGVRTPDEIAPARTDIGFRSAMLVSEQPDGSGRITEFLSNSGRFDCDVEVDGFGDIVDMYVTDLADGVLPEPTPGSDPRL